MQRVTTFNQTMDNVSEESSTDSKGKKVKRSYIEKMTSAQKEAKLRS